MNKIKKILYSIFIILLFAIPLMIVCTAVWAGLWTAFIFMFVQSLSVVFSAYSQLIVAEALVLAAVCTIIFLMLLAEEAGAIHKIPSYLLFECFNNNKNTLSNFKKCIIYLLVKLGADINGFQKYDGDPQIEENPSPRLSSLAVAIKRKHIEKIIFLIKNGADIYDLKFYEQFPDEVNWPSPLTQAVQSGALAVVKALNIQRKTLAKLSRSQQVALLEYALLNHSYDIAKYLMKKGIVLNVVEEKQFFAELKLNINPNDFHLKFKSDGVEAKAFFKLNDTFGKSGGYIILSVNEDDSLTYIIKNHFGKRVSGKTKLLLEKNKITFSLVNEIIHEIIFKVYQDDFKKLMKPYIKKQKQAIFALVMPADNGRYTVDMPDEVRNLIIDFVGGDFKRELQKRKSEF